MLLQYPVPTIQFNAFFLRKLTLILLLQYHSAYSKSANLGQGFNVEVHYQKNCDKIYLKVVLKKTTLSVIK